MPLATTEQSLKALRRSDLGSTPVPEALPTPPPSPPADSGWWARDLMGAGALTAYQAEQLLASRADDLVLGQYRVLDQLGMGGMSLVYRAEHVLLERVVALKVLLPQVAREPGALERFRGEGRAAALLCHPNVVTVHDAGEDRGLHYLVTELVDGPDLERLVRQEGPLPLATACDYIRQAALGLHHLHTHGLVHCDIKPSNLLLAASADGQGGVIKLLDLGLARPAGAAVPRGDSAAASALGDAGGTPAYLAPELALADAVPSVQSDLYSLGCTFYFLLTGQVPYAGSTWSEIILRHQLDAPAAITHLRPDLPAEVAVLVYRLLEKDPAQRPSSAAELALLLETALSSEAALPAPGGTRRLNHADATEPARTQPAASPWRRLRWPVALVLAVLAGLSVARAVRQVPAFLPPRPTQAVASLPLRSGYTLASQPGAVFLSLADAVTLARDGDIVTLHRDGPEPLTPLEVRGKALTLRAAPGVAPQLVLIRTPPAAEWKALLSSDRALTLEGLELRGPSGEEQGSVRTTHLVQCDSAPLTLLRCRLAAPHGQGLLVCRQVPRLVMHDCHVQAAASALGVELGTAGSEVQLSGCHIQVADPVSAALALWGTPRGAGGTGRLLLEGCTLQAGRVVSLTGPSARLQVCAHGNTFSFHHALLSFAGFGPGRTWHDAASWHGHDNRFAGAGSWLLADGRPLPVHGLAAWRSFWRSAELASAEATPHETAFHRDAE